MTYSMLSGDLVGIAMLMIMFSNEATVHDNTNKDGGCGLVFDMEGCTGRLRAVSHVLITCYVAAAVTFRYVACMASSLNLYNVIHNYTA